MRLAPFSWRFNKKCMSEKSSSRQAPDGGVSFLDRPVPLQVNILQRIPILELKRLH
jgi:hypothetical protein